MKTFLLALVVFGLIIGTLVFTGIYLTRKTDELSDAAKALPPMDTAETENTSFYDAAKNFSAVWTSAKKTIHFIIGHKDADRIEETFVDLQARYLLKDTAGYTSARVKLLYYIKELADSEALSFDTIT